MHAGRYARLLLLSSLLLPHPARAQGDLFDQLRCYDVVDDRRDVAAAGALTLSPENAALLEQTGCEIRGDRAREVCAPVRTTPAAGPSGEPLAAHYLCYKLRCDRPRSTKAIALDLADEFGSGTVLVRERRSGQRLCVPSPDPRPPAPVDNGAANALVMPFDATTGHTTSLLVSNPFGVTRAEIGTILGVSTHWSFWSETCDHLAAVDVCLTLHDTIVVDPTEIRSIDVGNQPVGATTDLSGNRGLVVVTAYETDELCSDPSKKGFVPVDDALVGSYAIADTTGVLIEREAIRLGLDPTGSHTVLPAAQADDHWIPLRDPDVMGTSLAILLSLKEQGGEGPHAAITVGPESGPIKAVASVYDSYEIPYALPDVSIGCVLFTSLVPGEGLIPDSVHPHSEVLVRLGAFVPPIGGTTGRYLFETHGQRP